MNIREALTEMDMGRGAEMNRRNANAALPHQKLSPRIEMGAGRDANTLALGAGKESASYVWK